MAVGIILSRLIQGNEKALFNIKGNVALILAGIGTALYALIGFSTIFLGGKFLEYGRLPFSVHDPAELHALGMLGIEIGVTLCVMMTIVAIFDALTGEEEGI